VMARSKRLSWLVPRVGPPSTWTARTGRGTPAPRTPHDTTSAIRAGRANSNRRATAVLIVFHLRATRDKVPPVSNSTDNGVAGKSNGGIAAGKAGADGLRVERQFQARPPSSAKVVLGLGFLGSAALGAGVFGLWLAPSVVPGASALLAGGALGLIVALYGGREVPPVRVGELGVTYGDPTEATRLAWCDVQAVRVVGDVLRLETVGAPVDVPLAAHGRAAARIVAEASKRLGQRVDVSPRAHERLPPLAESDGEIVPALRLQLAGRRCAVSGKSITFESDARLCPNCAAVYHASHVPAECTSCQRPLGVGEVRAPLASS
jgi:hypothetical protein